MSTINRISLYLGIAALAGAAGYYTGKGQKEVQVIERQGEVRTEWKTRIITKTRVVRPDGTVEETETVKDTEGEKETSTVSRDKLSRPALSSYSLGIRYWSKAPWSNQGQSGPITANRDNSKFEIDQLEITVGRRLVGELWMDVGIRKHGMSLGISMQF